MSTMRVTTLKNENSATDQIVLNADGSIGGGLGDALAAKADAADLAALTAGATASVATGQSTVSTSYTDLATAGPAVTLTTGTRALVVVTARLGSASSAYTAYMGFAISGASSVAASDSFTLRNAVSTGTGLVGPVSAVYYVTGLTAGSNTFTAKYRAEEGTVTAYFYDRSITVIDLGS